MPIPLILGGLAVLAGGYGVKKGIDAKEDMDTANAFNKMAKELVENAENDTDEARKRTSKSVTELGRLKIKILSGSIKKFVKNFSTDETPNSSFKIF